MLQSQSYYDRALGKGDATASMTREERKLAAEMELFHKLETGVCKHTAEAGLVKGGEGGAVLKHQHNAIEDWARCERCNRWRIVRLAISGSDAAFVCEMQPGDCCDTPEEKSWVCRMAFDPYESNPTLELCLFCLQQLAFKVPELGYFPRDSNEVQTRMVCLVTNARMSDRCLTVKQVAKLLTLVVSHIDKRYVKSYWKREHEEGWLKAIRLATCADTLYDAGIKLEKCGLDWTKLHSLRASSSSCAALHAPAAESQEGRQVSQEAAAHSTPAPRKCSLMKTAKTGQRTPKHVLLGPLGHGCSTTSPSQVSQSQSLPEFGIAQDLLPTICAARHKHLPTLVPHGVKQKVTKLQKQGGDIEIEHLHSIYTKTRQTRVPQSRTRAPQEDASIQVLALGKAHDDATHDTQCQVCHSPYKEDKMLLCDKCNAGWHLDCLIPPLTTIPSGVWECPHCTPCPSLPPVTATKVFDSNVQTRQQATKHNVNPAGTLAVELLYLPCADERRERVSGHSDLPAEDIMNQDHEGVDEDGGGVASGACGAELAADDIQRVFKGGVEVCACACVCVLVHWEDVVAVVNVFLLHEPCVEMNTCACTLLLDCSEYS